jgi:hypothetical protein
MALEREKMKRKRKEKRKRRTEKRPNIVSNMQFLL